jgi:isopentenyl diphosphate isomerase/L-lactate dehydrogenase-like FMN-dependent dehydrogenase
MFVVRYASVMRDLGAVVSLRGLEAVARDVLPAAHFDYIAGGGWDEVTVADNEAAFARARLVPRFLNDVSDVRTETTVLGATISAPAGFAPTALHDLVHPEGELVGARVFAETGLPFVLSTLSNRSIEAVAEAAPDGVRWFQLYVNTDRAVARSHVERAEAAGYRAIVVTVDVPADGHRPRDLRNAFEAPGTFGNFTGDHLYDAPFGELLGGLMDPSLSWADIDEIRGWTSLPVVVKGLLSPKDATLAVEHGVAGIWVSNHGGRQLDRAIASLDALGPVVDAVAGRAEVFLDSGVRDGVDVVTALATGARAVFLGRPFLYALAIGGEPGLRAAATSLAVETKRAMALLGTATVADIGRDHLADGAARG